MRGPWLIKGDAPVILPLVKYEHITQWMSLIPFVLLNLDKDVCEVIVLEIVVHVSYTMCVDYE